MGLNLQDRSFFLASMGRVFVPSAKNYSKMKYEEISGKKWWKEAIVYQVYPRSFKDSNGDGIGDLQGIISKLDYLQSLGIDVVWLNPVYASPNDDNGYDISDYRNIMEEFGSMQDFDELLAGLHKRNIRLVMDLVVNHTSDEHEWFKQSRSGRKNPYRDYYHWWPAEKGKPPHRPSFFDERGSGWQYDRKTNAYYLHIFSVKQPDLNWENPKLRKEIYDMMNFWFEKGVDGFRMDAITFIAKDEEFPFIPEEVIQEKFGEWSAYYASFPKIHDYLHEMHKESLSKYDVMTVAEGPGISPDEAHKFVDPAREELNMLYHFEGMGIGYVQGEFKRVDPEGYDLVKFKEIYTKWSEIFSKKGWGTIYLGNHDQPRMVSRWGNDRPEFKDASAKMLTTFLFTMHATPFFYFGDEIGMSNIRFDKIDDYRDIESINMYKQLKRNKGDLKRFIENQKESARDNSRTPFQWDASENAGFTKGKPWLSINPNYKKYNVEAQEKDPASILNYFRKLVKVRKAHPVLLYGHYTLLDKEHKQVYAYTRTLGDERFLVLLNFSTENIDYKLPGEFRHDEEILINNYENCEQQKDKIRLLPYQAIVMQAGKH
jgi:oligo-1,6-glucosidase